MIEPNKFVGYLRRACVDILERGTIDARRRYPLRLGQTQGYQALIVYLDRGDLTDAEKLEGFFKMTVGLGKTGFYEALIDRLFQYASVDGVGFRVGIVTPKIELLDQIYREVKKFFPALEDKIGIYGGYWPKSHKPRRETDKPATAITFPSWAKRVDRGEMNDTNTDMLITDEGHRGTSEARQELLLKNFVHAARFAFQGTPHFSELKTVINTHKREIFSKGLVESVRDGESAKYIRAQHHVIRVAPPKEGEPFDPVRAKQLAFIELVKTLSLTGVDSTGKAIGYDEVTGDRLTDNQMGVYTGDTAHADKTSKDLNAIPELQKIAGDFKAKAFAVSVHTNGIDHGRQKALKQEYESGLRRALCGDELFKEGWNYEPLKWVVVYQTGSIVDLEQIIGRGARQFRNELKQRYEGLTAVSTTIYIGVDPVFKDPEKPDPEEIKRAKEADDKARKRALAASVSAVDILGGVEVLGPGVKPRKKKPGGGGGPHPPFTGIQIKSYTTVEDMKTIHAEREEARRELVECEPMVDWTKPENRKAFEELWAKKEKPTSRTLFKSLPDQAKMPDDRGVILFISHNVIYHILARRVDKISERQLLALMQTLEALELDKIIEWKSNPKNQKAFNELRKKKGNPGGKLLFESLPSEAKKPDANGKILFSSENIVNQIIAGRIKDLTKRRLDVLMQTIEKMNDMIDWANAENRKAFEELREKKGNPGAQTLFALHLEEARILNVRPIFSSWGVMHNIIHNRSEIVNGQHLETLTRLLENLSEEQVDTMRAKEKLVAAAVASRIKKGTYIFHTTSGKKPINPTRKKSTSRSALYFPKT